MRGYLPREIESTIQERLAAVPVVAIIGPRQCGKSTTARQILSRRKSAIHLDLERPADLRMLSDPEALFSANTGRLICIDEIQRKPDLFPVMRYWTDRQGTPGQFLVLGSASPDLLRQSSESLAGRISFVELTPFLLSEISDGDIADRRDLLRLRGGYPRSYLAHSEEISYQWRLDFITSYLERDLPALGVQLDPNLARRFWTMLAHSSGSSINYTRLGNSLGVSHNTIRRYADILARTFMARLLPAYSRNVGKRLVKAPKVLLRDTGILHALLEIERWNSLLAHPVAGASWECFAIEQILAAVGPVRASYYRTESGAELDLVVERKDTVTAVECKISSAPETTRGFWSAIQTLKPDASWLVAPVDRPYPLDAARSVMVGRPQDVIRSVLAG